MCICSEFEISCSQAVGNSLKLERNVGEDSVNFLCMRLNCSVGFRQLKRIVSLRFGCFTCGYLKKSQVAVENSFYLEPPTFFLKCTAKT